MSIKSVLMFAIGVAFFFSVGGPVNGQSLIVKKFGTRDSLRKFVSNTALLEVVHGTTSVSSTSINQDERINVIIELSTRPQKPVKGTSAARNTASFQQQFTFVNTVASIAPQARILHQFSEVLNAVSITASRTEISAIAGLAGVKGVYEDKKVIALAVGTTSSGDEHPVAVTTDSTKAGGVRIGVIDTGIDYLHEAFGGGFGPGYTVAGGYNFVSNSSDPRDDNGHGTHVAGIIAGNSRSFKGMAPHSQLFAYKVLDAQGNGITSTVIAAIEQAIHDSVQIINLSLGTAGGDPDDILSQSVDRAVEMGIVVVVAAGNDGDYGTIDSPGAAREALTVGATDAKNSVASFSSKGPSNKIYGFKPDIVAPGESILSAKMNGGYVLMSGTSMAAPYVTGAAALLRQRHPEWSAHEVRDALLASTQDLRGPIFSAGRGKLDTTKIPAATTIVTPAAISFGFDNPSSAKWTRSDSLLVVNLSPRPKTYSFKLLSEKAGIKIDCSPAVFTVDANNSRSVAIELTADNALLPDNSVFPQGYYGEILGVSITDTLIIPYVFFKGSVIQISFNETPFQVVIHDQKKNAYYYNPAGTFLSAFVPTGVYDIIATFTGPAYVVKENINTNESADLTISRDQATHTIVVSPTDENETALATTGPHTTYSYVEALRHNTSGVSEVILGGGKVQTQTLDQKIFFSDMSSRYSFGYALNVQLGNSRSYTYDVELDTGITSSRTVTFAPSDFKRIEFKYDIDSTTPRVFPVIWSAFTPSTGVIAVTYFDGDSTPLTYPFIQTGFYMRRTSINFPILHFREAYRY